MRILMLVERMEKGFGVAVVVANLAERLGAMGHVVTVASVTRDDTARNVRLLESLSYEAVDAVVRSTRADVVVAHCAPFFEYLPELPARLHRVAWEHGDPSPDLFVAHGDADERRAIAQRKRDNVYPRIDRVVAISEFIRSDIAWPAAVVIPNGADHVADLGPKDTTSYVRRRKLRVGTLMRLGIGEAHYKGNGLFIALSNLLAANECDCELVVMGRGEATDGREFEQSGIRVVRNATDDERSKFLRELDVFVSCSLWEGFNLPLAEAAMSGTACLALDTGAHPEVTPLVFAGIGDVAAQLLRYDEERLLLQRDSLLCYRHVSRHCRWAEAAARFSAILPTMEPPTPDIARSEAGVAEHSVEHDQPRPTAGVFATFADRIRRRLS